MVGALTVLYGIFKVLYYVLMALVFGHIPQFMALDS